MKFYVGGGVGFEVVDGERGPVLEITSENGLNSLTHRIATTDEILTQLSYYLSQKGPKEECKKERCCRTAVDPFYCSQDVRGEKVYISGATETVTFRLLRANMLPGTLTVDVNYLGSDEGCMVQHLAFSQDGECNIVETTCCPEVPRVLNGCVDDEGNVTVVWNRSPIDSTFELLCNYEYEVTY